MGAPGMLRVGAMGRSERVGGALKQGGGVGSPRGLLE